MCLAIPVKLMEIPGLGRGIVDSGGVSKEVDISLLEAPAPGDFVLVHAGFAIEKIDAEEAERTLGMFREMMENPE